MGLLPWPPGFPCPTALFSLVRLLLGENGPEFGTTPIRSPSFPIVWRGNKCGETTAVESRPHGQARSDYRWTVEG